MLKYKEIFEDIKSKINSGEYQGGSLFFTEKELTSMYNVSRTTIQKSMQLLVSENLLNRYPGKGSFVRDEDSDAGVTDEPNKRVAMILPNKGDSMFICMQGANNYFSEHNVDLLLYFYNDNTSINSLKLDSLDGVIVYPLHPDIENNYFYEKLMRAVIPIVSIDTHLFPHSNINHVTSNNFNGGYLAAEHLLELGHRKILSVFTKTTCSDTFRDRIVGFYAGCKQGGVTLSSLQSIVLPLGGDPDAILLERFKKLLPEERPTAVFCCADDLAARLYQVFQSLGLSIPGDISVIGFDNRKFASLLSPPLTTIEQPFFDIGKYAATLLLQTITSRSQAITEIQLPVTLIKRASVSAVRARPSHKLFIRAKKE